VKSDEEASEIVEKTSWISSKWCWEVGGLNEEP